MGLGSCSIKKEMTEKVHKMFKIKIKFSVHLFFVVFFAFNLMFCHI